MHINSTPANTMQLAVIKQFAGQLGYQDSNVVTDEGFALAIDNKVQINILNQEDNCHLIAYLAPVSDENRLELYETLLQANHNQDELAGGSLGICPKKKGIALSLSLESEGLEVSQLQQAFDRLLEKSLFWHHRLNDGQIAEQTNEPSLHENTLSLHALMV